jgi:hypothetical protein
MSRILFVRLVAPVLAIGLITAVAAVAGPRATAAEDDDRTADCTNASLRGDYGVLVSGVRGTPAGFESFVGTAFHSYDGKGNFAGFDNTQGEFTSSVDRPVKGTYQINPDCTGTTSMIVGPGVVVQTSIVVVERGREVVEAVMSPKGNRVTAVQHRIR